MLRRTLFTRAQPCPDQFLRQMTARGFTSFFGVPDSLLKELCKCITFHGSGNKNEIGLQHHIIAANEGNAIGLAAGYHLSTQQVPVVYMQNSGLGNCVNPLTSLTHSEVYRIPMLLLIGWRGMPGAKKDEPQHVAMGRLTTNILESCEVPYALLSKNAEESAAALDQAKKHLQEKKTPFAILVDRDTFANAPASCSTGNSNSGVSSPSSLSLSREGAIEQILKSLPSSTPVVGNTGMISREVFETRQRLGMPNSSDFLTVGAMGHASSIAAGIALGGDASSASSPVVCLDGDGAFVMHMGAAAIAGAPSTPAAIRKRLVHIVLNNGAHDSVGGQPTVGFEANLSSVAQSCGYEVLPVAETAEQLDKAVSDLLAKQQARRGDDDADNNKNIRPLFLEVRVKKGNRKDLGRPTSSAAENRAAFMEFLQKQN